MKADAITKKRNVMDKFASTLETHRAAAPPTREPLHSTSSGDSPQIDTALLERAHTQAHTDPRFTGWSVPAKCTFMYLAETTPKFRASHLINTYVECGLQTEYPELWARITALTSKK